MHFITVNFEEGQVEKANLQRWRYLQQHVVRLAGHHSQAGVEVGPQQQKLRLQGPMPAEWLLA